MSREGESETQRWVGGWLEAAGMGTAAQRGQGAGSPFGVMNMLGTQRVAMVTQRCDCTQCH